MTKLAMIELDNLATPRRRWYRPVVRSIASLVSILGLGAASGGCALILSGTNASIPIDSEPQGAEVFIDGVPAGSTPVTVALTTSDDHVILLKRAGYPDQTVKVERRFEGGYLVLDILFTALVGVVVDAATGAWWEAVPQDLNVILPQEPREDKR